MLLGCVLLSRACICRALPSAAAPLGPVHDAVQAGGRKNSGRRGRRRAVLAGTYSCARQAATAAEGCLGVWWIGIWESRHRCVAAPHSLPSSDRAAVGGRGRRLSRSSHACMYTLTYMSLCLLSRPRVLPFFGCCRMFGPAVPEHSIILLLSVVFCVINPLVLCCGLVFFAMALVVESYNWGLVFRRPYEGGRELWQQVCCCCAPAARMACACAVLWPSAELRCCCHRAPLLQLTALPLLLLVLLLLLLMSPCRCSGMLSSPCICSRA